MEKERKEQEEQYKMMQEQALQNYWMQYISQAHDQSKGDKGHNNNRPAKETNEQNELWWMEGMQHEQQATNGMMEGMNNYMNMNWNDMQFNWEH